MLNDPQLQKITREIVEKALPKTQLRDVLTSAASDSEGNDALRIVLVLTPESINEMSGDQALDLLVDIHNGLDREGESRFAMIEYATEAELAEEASEAADAIEDGGTDDES